MARCFRLIASCMAIAPSMALAQPQPKVLAQFPAHDLKGEAIVEVACARQSARVATVASDGTAKVWDESGTLQASFTPENRDMLFNGRFIGMDEAGFAVAAYNGYATVWASSTARPLLLGPHLSGVTDVELLPSGRGYATSSDDGFIRFWSANGTLLKRIERPGVNRHLALSESLNLLAATQDIGTVSLFSTDGALLNTVQTGQGRLNDVVFSPDQPLMLTGGFDGTVKVWRVGPEARTVTLLQTFAAQPGAGWVEGVAINRDGMVAVVSDDGSLQFWTLKGESLGRITLSPSHHLMSLCFTADQRRVRTLAQDGTLTTVSIPQPR